MRVGFGYDAHRFEAGRSFILGGVEIDFEKGLGGHSDADVLLHAIIDALLGAAALGDIGRHFSPADDAYKDISSMVLLDRTLTLVKDAGFVVVNIDSTIVCERPRLAAAIPEMVSCISRGLFIEEGAVNVKATTTEKMGFTGTGEGVAVYAVALVEKSR